VGGPGGGIPPRGPGGEQKRLNDSGGRGKEKADINRGGAILQFIGFFNTL